MQVPTEITFHGLDHSDAVELAVRRWVARLEHMNDRITKCGVVIGKPHKSSRRGCEFQVSVVCEVPGGEIAATHAAHVDVYVAVADAFRTVRRQIQTHVDVQRGFIKRHSQPQLVFAAK